MQSGISLLLFHRNIMFPPSGLKYGPTGDLLRAYLLSGGLGNGRGLDGSREQDGLY
jgi:hypothetical protein